LGIEALTGDGGVEGRPSRHGSARLRYHFR
jgi:hypothetical protein